MLCRILVCLNVGHVFFLKFLLRIPTLPAFFFGVDNRFRQENWDLYLVGQKTLLIAALIGLRITHSLHIWCFE